MSQRFRTTVMNGHIYSRRQDQADRISPLVAWDFLPVYTSYIDMHGQMLLLPACHGNA